MEKGSPHPAPERGARVLALVLTAGLAAAAALGGGPERRPAASPSWWQIKVTVALKGRYEIRGDVGRPVVGEFAGRAVWEGLMIRDGQEVRIYKLWAELPEWSLEEPPGRPTGERVFAPDATSTRPALILNYILREGQELVIDYEMGEIPLPQRTAGPPWVLELPRSPRRASLQPSYGDYVQRGSALLALTDADLERASVDKPFSWEWRRERRREQNGRRTELLQLHSVEAVVSLVAH